jgi:hypothetical protein
MSSSEKFCLKWNDFNQNVSTTFGDLRNDAYFTDVTLACEDGQQMEAHKVILAASSPFFQRLLKTNKHPHPMIYMRGMKASELSAIIDFLYLGEANVIQENLDAFLALAEELQLKGLTGGTTEPKVEETINKLPTNKIQRPAQTKLTNETNVSNISNGTHELEIKEDNPERIVALSDFTAPDDMQGLDEMIESMMTKTNSTLGGNYGNKKGSVCKVCGKEGQRINIQQHIESNHIEGVSHTCNICGKSARSRHALRMHTSSYHKEYKYSIDLTGRDMASAITDENIII